MWRRVVHCGAVWRGMEEGVGEEGELAVEFGLEAGVFFPARDRVGIDVEGGGDGGDGVAGEEEARCGELVGVKGFGILAMGWV